jgi:hypothetical protein
MKKTLEKRTLEQWSKYRGYRICSAKNRRINSRAVKTRLADLDAECGGANEILLNKVVGNWESERVDII